MTLSCGWHYGLLRDTYVIIEPLFLGLYPSTSKTNKHTPRIRADSSSYRYKLRGHNPTTPRTTLFCSKESRQFNTMQSYHIPGTYLYSTEEAHPGNRALSRKRIVTGCAAVCVLFNASPVITNMHGGLPQLGGVIPRGGVKGLRVVMIAKKRQ